MVTCRFRESEIILRSLCKLFLIPHKSLRGGENTALTEANVCVRRQQSDKDGTAPHKRVKVSVYIVSYTLRLYKHT